VSKSDKTDLLQRTLELRQTWERFVGAVGAILREA
jgi:hypothetical protein